MSSIVKDIREAFESSIATTLPTYEELKYKFDLFKNHGKNTGKRYGVIAGAAEGVSGVLTNYTADRDFTVILSNQFTNKTDDSKQQIAIDELEDALDEIVKEVSCTKLVPGKVLNIVLSSIEEINLEVENAVSLQAIFTIKYRNQLN
jgi:hypothetical protein